MRVYLLDMGSLCGWLYHASENNDLLASLTEWTASFRRQLKPTHMVACFDAGRGGRELVDPEYKCGRVKSEGYVTSLALAKDHMADLGIYCWSQIPFEADDLICSFCKFFLESIEHEKDECVIVSDDKDMMALVDDNYLVSQYSPSKGVFYDEQAVIDKFGFDPWRITEYLACAGDSADNVPGIKGIGKKHATEAFKQTKSMAELFRKARDHQLTGLRPSTQELFVTGMDQYQHSLQLTRMREDAKCPDISDLEVTNEIK